MPGHPELSRDGALVHRAVARQARVLLVQRDQAAGEALVLERLAQDARARDGPPVVGEPGGAEVGELGHLGERLAVLADRDRGEEAGRDPRLLPRALAQRRSGSSRCPPPGRCSAARGSRRSRPRRRRACRSRCPPRPRARACAGGRAGRRRPGPRRARRRRSPRRPRASAGESPSSATSPPRSRMSWAPSRPARGSSSRAPRIRTSVVAVAAESSGGASKRGGITRPPSARARARPRRAWAPPIRRAARRAPPSCTTTPDSTCWVISACGESITSDASSTPRLTGPGCISSWPAPRRRPSIW